MSTELIHYNAARKALAQARRVDEVKSIHDKARAMEAYAKLANDHELIQNAIEIRMRSEIRAGELLAEMKVRGERETKGGNRKSKSPPVTLIPKLSDLGVSKMQSSRWQKLAKLSEREQETRIKAAKEAAGLAIEKMDKSKRSQSKTRERDDPISHVKRGALKARQVLVTVLGSLTEKERQEFYQIMRFQIDDLERTYGKA